VRADIWTRPLADARRTAAAPMVLIVDDDVAVMRTFARMLQLGGFDVATALSVENALRETGARRPDAVLVDLCMPNGLAFLRQLRTNDGLQHTPVAVVTGAYFVAAEVMRELEELDASLYFKPLWLDDLLQIVTRLTALS
jgi:CheY-like chemotaxis protein